MGKGENAGYKQKLFLKCLAFLYFVNYVTLPTQSRLLTHYQTTNFSLFKLKDFADDNFKFDENGRKLSKRIENTVGKGEIARYEQFLLFPQCFQKACFLGVSKGVSVWEWVKHLEKEAF